MAVFTEINLQQVNQLLTDLTIGSAISLTGISSGIENSNYFLTTTKGEYVLTIFERLTPTQLPFYLDFMQHLAKHNILVPKPELNLAGEHLFTLAGKPCAIVNKLSGESQLSPNAQHCAIIGTNLAKMHLAALNFTQRQPNLRGISWWNTVTPQILPFLTNKQQQLLTTELKVQQQLQQTTQYQQLTKAVVHCDLFRDNVLFTSDQQQQPQLGGFFDFYFAGYDSLIFDLAVCLNDWCINQQSLTEAVELKTALLDCYNTIRPLTELELSLLPKLLRSAALRFWISRLWDFYLPRNAKMLTAHDPKHFEKILTYRIEQNVN